MKVMLSKLVKGQESQRSCLTEIKVDISGLTQKVESHAITIKKLEHQFGQKSETLNQRKSGTLPSNTVQNPKNDNHYLAITTQSGKAIVNSSMPIVDKFGNDVVGVDEAPEAKLNS